MAKIAQSLLSVTCAVFLVLGAFTATVKAQQTVLPTGPAVEEGSCEQFVKDNSGAYTQQKAFLEKYQPRENRGDLLGCAIVEGRIRLYMMPFFITYLIEVLLAIAGLIAVLFVVWGGFKYVVGGLIEEKEQGKKIVQNALIGLLVALGAWMIVNAVQIALTT